MNVSVTENNSLARISAYVRGKRSWTDFRKSVFASFFHHLMQEPGFKPVSVELNQPAISVRIHYSPAWATTTMPKSEFFEFAELTRPSGPWQLKSLRHFWWNHWTQSPGWVATCSNPNTSTVVFHACFYINKISRPGSHLKTLPTSSGHRTSQYSIIQCTTQTIVVDWLNTAFFPSKNLF